MSLAKLVVATFRRLRSVLVLAVTISTLFYYTFQNEIDILNSYAENEYLPSINNEHLEHATAQTSELMSNLISVNPGANPAAVQAVQAAQVQAAQAHAQAQAQPPVQDKKGPPADANKDHSDTQASLDGKLSDPAVFKEKNKYFPLLLQSPAHDPTNQWTQEETPSMKELAVHKEKYPLMYELSLSSFYADDTVQESTKGLFALVSSDPKVSYKEDRNDVRKLLVKSWDQQRLHFLSMNMEKMWPIGLVDALDTLYIMEETALFQNAVERIAETDFKIPPVGMTNVNVVDVSTRILGGLISAYDLSQEKVLLTKARELADFLLRAFDTPNRIPLLNYAWKSPYKNRFPYMEANIADFTKVALEFTRLTKLTGANKYFDAVYHILVMIAKSTQQLNIEGLFPDSIDASTCQLLTSDAIHKGAHQRNSRIMKSIDENFKFVHCHQLDYFPETSSSYKLDDKLLPLYDLYLQLYSLLKADVFGNSETIPTNSSHLYHQGINQISRLFTFQPKVPAQLGNLTLLANLDTNPIFSPSTNELNINLRRDFKFHPESCALGATLAYGSKLFPENNVTDLALAGNVTESCFKLAMYMKGTLAEVSLDPCIGGNCVFDAAAKLDDIMSGKYIGFANGFSSGATIGAVKLDTPAEKKIKRSLMDKKPSIKEAINVAGGGDVDDEDIPKDVAKDEIDGSEKTTIKTYHFIKDEQFTNVYHTSNSINNDKNSWKYDEKRPLWINGLSHQQLTSPDLIKAIFFMYRTTGDEKWRVMGKQLKDEMIRTMEQTFQGAKGSWKVSEFEQNSDGIPSHWFSQTLKYFYLLFSDASEYSLDEYVFTESAHILKRRIIKPAAVHDRQHL